MFKLAIKRMRREEAVAEVDERQNAEYFPIEYSVLSARRGWGREG
jgi:hypothetical protein